ncbi:MAG: hypothetical protein UW94_C0012G0032 [Parcubacteria group bacterium GW2011_GWA2_45_14]|nr:MAG: hypothetical protein UW94_C0012G0032 [Parcubacteria group bacterium GW2011_GWA2_45_14]OGY34438.1 MAG: hypothetical protein A3B76_03965 [Candidatus Andersenbacteria bacterium RIFCSPHIGHO2_02_FULL_46_16]
MMNEQEVRRLRFEMSTKLSLLADESGDKRLSLASVLLDPLATDEEVGAEFAAANMTVWLERVLAVAERIEADAKAAEEAIHFDRQTDWETDISDAEQGCSPEPPF